MSVCFPKNSPAESSLFPSDDSSTFWTTFRVWLRWTVIGLSLTAMVAGALSLIPETVPPQLLTVEKAPFRIEITTGGSLEPLRTERVISQCQWTVQILSLVPEGTWVRKGDIVCVLDSSEIEEFRRAREVSLIKAQSSLEASRQQEEIVRAANERRLAEAEHQRQNAEMDLFEYTNGTHPNAVGKLDDDISINADRLRAVEYDLQFAERMWMLGYASRPEVAAESLKATTQSEQLRRLEAQKNLLEQYTHPRQDVLMKHQLTNSRLNVIRTELANSLALSRAALAELSDERRLAIYERYAKAATDSIQACVLRAPRDGQILHCNNWNLRSRGIKTIEEGKSIYFSQPVFEIPDQDHLKISLPLNESLITKVAVGNEITIRPVGFETLDVRAEITRISPYPVVRSSFAPDLKEYFLNAVLKPDATQQEFLHPRMEAEGIVTVLDRTSAISVPKEAVARCGSMNVVLMKSGEDFLPCQVTPGEVSEGKVLIESGLHEGDQIIASISELQRQKLQEELLK